MFFCELYSYIEYFSHISISTCHSVLMGVLTSSFDALNGKKIHKLGRAQLSFGTHVGYCHHTHKFMPLYTQEGIRNKKLPKQCRAHGASPFSNAISYTLLSGGPTFLDFTNDRRSTSFNLVKWFPFKSVWSLWNLPTTFHGFHQTPFGS